MGETRAHGTGLYGNVVLSRLPVLGSGRCDLSFGWREPRGCVRVDLDVDGTPLHVFNCHFGLALRERREQLGLLGAFIRASGRLAGPRVLLGDFNEWHRGPVTRGLRRAPSADPLGRRPRRPVHGGHRADRDGVRALARRTQPLRGGVHADRRHRVRRPDLAPRGDRPSRPRVGCGKRPICFVGDLASGPFCAAYRVVSNERVACYSGGGRRSPVMYGDTRGGRCRRRRRATTGR